MEGIQTKGKRMAVSCSMAIRLFQSGKTSSWNHRRIPITRRDFYDVSGYCMFCSDPSGLCGWCHEGVKHGPANGWFSRPGGRIQVQILHCSFGRPASAVATRRLRLQCFWSRKKVTNYSTVHKIKYLSSHRPPLLDKVEDSFHHATELEQIVTSNLSIMFL